MKNSFDIEVNLAVSPVQPFEWERGNYIFGIKLLRVNTKCLFDLMTYECQVDSPSKILLLSDSKTSIVVKLDDKGNVVKRSFLPYEKDLSISEFASSMRINKLSYCASKNKIVYSKELTEEIKIKNYLIDSIKNMRDEEKSQYLYYLYFDDIKDYSKEKLISSIRESNSNKCFKLYDFLIKN